MMKIGDIDLDYLGYSGFSVLGGKGIKIVVDPCNISESRASGKADVVLITHNHRESCSIKDIERVVREDGKTCVICPADCQSKILKLRGVRIEVVEVGDKIDMGSIKVETVPAYNKYRDDHPKSEGWLGYLIKIGNTVIYHAGDTDFIPEMQRLSGYGKRGNSFVVLLPVSGKTVMNAEQASDAASLISPDLAVPMGYKSKEDALDFVEFCKEKNIKAEILEKV